MTKALVPSRGAGGDKNLRSCRLFFGSKLGPRRRYYNRHVLDWCSEVGTEMGLGNMERRSLRGRTEKYRSLLSILDIPLMCVVGSIKGIPWRREERDGGM